jgi:putative ABC transport system ATP-binding protein
MPFPHSPTKAILKARNLHHAFGVGEARTTALRGVSLELHRGELTLFMGPSGSGKSTLLSVISGLMRPDHGRVVGFGQDYWQLSRKEQDVFRLRHFGHVPQKLDLIPALTARQQIEMMLRWGMRIGRQETRRRTNDLLDRLGLLGKANQRPDQLSGGEKQRVAIGRAIVKEPALVFADEPTSALDKHNGLNVIKLLRRHAHAHHASVVVVTHDLDLAQLADRVFTMEDGRIVESTRAVPRLVRRAARAAG